MEKIHTADYQLMLTVRKRIQICNWFIIMAPWCNNLYPLYIIIKHHIVSLDIESVSAVRKLL